MEPDELRGHRWMKDAEAETISDAGAQEGDRMRGPFPSLHDACATCTLRHGRAPFEDYALDASTVAVRAGRTWWTYELRARSASSQLTDVFSASRGVELVVRTRQEVKPKAPATWRPYTVETLAVCGVGASGIPHCMWDSLGTTGDLPEHHRVELACDGRVSVTGWQAQKEAEGGGAISAHSTYRITFP